MRKSKIFSRSVVSMRAMAMVDTGNTRHNAIKGYQRRNGFTIKVDYRDAYYQYYLNYGKGRTTKYKGWIQNAFQTIKSEVVEQLTSTNRISPRFKARAKRVQETQNSNLTHRDTRHMQAVNRGRGVIKRGRS